MSEWISVDDRMMPEIHKSYLVSWESRAAQGCAVAMYGHDGWHIATPWCGSHVRNHIGWITHWMPLPEPPSD